MPTLIQAVIVIVLFLMPGIYCPKRSIVHLSDLTTYDSRLSLTAITLSCVNYGVWSWLLVLSWQRHWYKSNVSLAFLSVHILFLSPAIGTVAFAKLTQTNTGRRAPLDIWHSTPHAKGLGLFVQCFSVGECRAAARVVSLVCGAGRNRDDSSKRTITKLMLISKETPDGRRLEVTG